jgi:hypothetical protein
MISPEGAAAITASVTGGRRTLKRRKYILPEGRMQDQGYALAFILAYNVDGLIFSWRAALRTFPLVAVTEALT